MPRLIYTLTLWFLLIPWALLHLLWRARRQPEYLGHWDERFGLYVGRQSHEPLIWIHAVSVGETRAAQPLIAALMARYPDHRILLTHTTPTGRQTSTDLFGESVERRYLPYDCPFAVGRFLSYFQPVIGILMETELWPNLIALTHQRGIPLLLVNARMSEKSARRYARFPQLTRGALTTLAGIAAQTEPDAQRLRSLGAREVIVTGNLKFDSTPPKNQLALGQRFRSLLGERSVFLCASTREGEEYAILKHWPDEEHALLVLVPRHPQRFDEVARLAESKGFAVQRRSDEKPVALETQVWIGDSLGELFAYYAASEVAFVGGSLLNYGCQNLIEPCAVGVPVLIGPSTFNFAETARAALAAGAAMQVGHAGELVNEARLLLANAVHRQSMGQSGQDFARRHQGATVRTMDVLQAHYESEPHRGTKSCSMPI